MNQEQPNVPKTIFCEKCLAVSTDKTPGDVSTMNGIGRKFYGAAEPCSTCGSVIRTLWFTLIDVPLIPLGSYRYKTATEEADMSVRFWCRKTGWHWSQILLTWVLGLVIGAAVFGAIWFFSHR